GDLGGGPGEVDVGAEVLGAHDAVGSAVGLAGDDGELGDRRLGEGVEQFGAVADDAAVLLLDAGHEAGDVLEGDEGDVEGVAEADEARALDAGVDVEDSGEEGGLVPYDADGPACHAGEAYDDVAGVVLVDLEEVAVVDD